MKGRRLVAWNVRKLRTAKGISQERLANDAGIARAYMSEVERATKAVTVDVLDKLAAVLGVAPADLLRVPAPGEEKPDPLPAGRRRG